MHKILLGIWFLSLLFCLPASGQDVTVSGQVTSSDDGTTLPGVSVQVKGTNRGTITDADGRYRLSVQPDNRLVFSFIGFASQEFPVGSQATINVKLTAGAQSLDEVVITAQGIERDKRSLGYSTQEVGGALIAQKSEPNLLNALQGKLAGVQINGQSGAPGASTNINIRGITSFNGSNQPLIVVDGIIFSNDVNVTGNTLFQAQSANRLADVNPESIESINILKGPAAAVLYGSRASAGAIIITTKNGKGNNNKTEVTVTSSYNVQNVYGIPPFQNDYGQGSNNLYVNNSTNSWGLPFVGGPTSITNLQGETRPYQAYPNNVRDFFRQGSVLQNTANISGGDATRNFNISLGNTSQQGITDNSKFTRSNVQLGGGAKLNNGLSISGTGTYVQTVQRGAALGNGGSAYGQISRIPRSYDLPNEPFQNASGQSIYFLTTANNPNWSLQNTTLDSQVDRFFGNFTLGYDVTKWLNVTYRVTGDTYTDRRKGISNIGAVRAPQGEVIQNNFFRSELNGDLLINAKINKVFLEGLSANLLLGNNINQRKFQNASVYGEQLTIPGFPNVSNAAVFTQSAESSQVRRLVGNYAQLSLAYNNYLFLELSGRADQSSTLPVANNTYFYPAASVSFVPTDAFKVQSDVLSYAKVRASVARVGRDADPYLLNSVYTKSSFGNNVAAVNFPVSFGGSSVPGFAIDSRIGNQGLTPEFVTSTEVGLNLGFFNNRLSIDAAYFNTRSTNQIFNVSVSPSSGYDTRTTNVGELQNRGIELVLSATPIRSNGFKWDVNLNFTRIRNKVVSIAPGVLQSGITGDGFIGITPSIVQGQPYGVIVSSANPRVQNTDINNKATYDASGQYVGQLIINPTSGQFAPVIAGQPLSNPNSNWTAGLTNTFSYKGFTLSALVDTRQGGQLFSFAAVDYRSTGSLSVTGIDRDQPRILPGVIQNADGTFRPNNIQLSAQGYWQGLGGLASEASVFDATVYRLREVALNYTLPKSIIGHTPFGGISVGVSGRNLYFYAPNYYADPEVNTQGAGNIQGLDLSGPPNTRNYGVNVRLTF
ncbi:SusC/RagA family TonB-linked outer membrane protein [Spirosoma utsteinense]|uniref:TonB-linked SusC/RagA family outer membrane protein n=1 Tax=Spirosoma utsteinense TaxID=2585773 RepID=A0ABR6W3D2_9BACT|nr:SusC/RagA family TonB-linked outer membrane protein [Spirosoma utsteinense]MBC3786677.1 TonB-linked SusC/RagA family outer membrane protein [Spirosoma utsteinense]MBC3791040.1 TonB-linked SusC/RagA family outer membrane protein [Spirosoma utsteinense]